MEWFWNASTRPDRSNEHAYSAANDDTSGVITLEDKTRGWLAELLMEGDLLEVCLDETQHLWRILNAAKPGLSDLTLINKRFKIMVSAIE